MKAIILIFSFAIYLISSDEVFGDDGSGSIDDGDTTSLTTVDPHIAKCKYLNSIRANYTICCKYPTLVLWYHQFEECKVECTVDGKEPDVNGCCMFVCCYKKLGALKFSDDPSQPATIDPEGLVYSFLLSVGNDTAWEPVIRKSTQRCYDDNNGVSTQVQCNIPYGFFRDIINCAYKENFLRCPVFNPHSLAECESTRQFVDECTGDASAYKADDSDTTAMTTQDPHNAKCKYLNSVRANYTICCNYPTLVLWDHQFEECREECTEEEKELDVNGCCMFVCCYKKIGAIKFSEDPSQPATIDPEGLVFSFMLSVGNDTAWEPVIRKSTQRCYDDNNGVSTQVECNIPYGFFRDIIDCAYKENFLRCPVYNPHGLPECESTRQFVDECTAAVSP